MNARTLALLAVLAGAAGCGKADPDAIVAYGRENSSGTYLYFKEHVLGNSDFAPQVQTLQGTAGVVNAVSKDPRSIGYGGIAYAKGVRAIKVKKDAASPGVEPNMENVVKGTYPISRQLFFYTIGEPQGAVRHFIDWVRGPEGQKLCEDVGYYPLPEAQRGKGAAGDAPKETITLKGSDTMVILAGKWAEAYMKRYPGAKVSVNGGGSGTGIKALQDGETHVCQSSRPMKQAEKEQVKSKQGKEPVEIAVALDGLAIFVHESSPLQEITLDQLNKIYRGHVKSWKALAGSK